MTHNTFIFNFYKKTFFGRYWRSKAVKAVVIIVHGMGEHSGRYTHVAKKLTENNYGVIAFDHFGHGKTTGRRGHNPNYNAVLESISQIITKAKEVFRDKPIFLYGHSMGGNAVINFALKKEHNLEGVVATSPFLRLAFQPPMWKFLLGKVMQRIAPSITLGNELNPNHISRDKKEVEKYSNDSLVHNRISVNFSLSFIDMGKWAIQNASSLTIPMFLIHGKDDKIIDYKGTKAFSKNSNKTSLKIYEKGYHELHNDLCKEEVFNDIVTWLDSQI